MRKINGSKYFIQIVSITWHCPRICKQEIIQTTIFKVLWGNYHEFFYVWEKPRLNKLMKLQIGIKRNNMVFQLKKYCVGPRFY